MKTTFTIILLMICLAFYNAQAQCNTGQHIKSSTKKLATGFTFLKSYPVTGETGKKYSYIFSTGAQYMITLANRDPKAKGVYITLYDSNNKQVATSYTNGKFYPAVAFKCQRTGIYHMKFSFASTNDHCAGAVLGMKR